MSIASWVPDFTAGSASAVAASAVSCAEVSVSAGEASSTARTERKWGHGGGWLFLQQPAGLVVVGSHRAASRVVDPLRRSLFPSGEVVEAHFPATVVAAPGIPLHAIAGDTALLKALADEFAQQHDCAVVVAANADFGGLLGDVFALVQDRSGEPLDALYRDSGRGRDLVHALSAPDPRLDLARAEPALEVELSLGRLRGRTLEEGTQALVDRHVFLFAILALKDQSGTVIGDAHQSKVCHGGKNVTPGEPTRCSPLDRSTAGPCCVVPRELRAWPQPPQ